MHIAIQVSVRRLGQEQRQSQGKTVLQKIASGGGGHHANNIPELRDSDSLLFVNLLLSGYIEQAEQKGYLYLLGPWRSLQPSHAFGTTRFLSCRVDRRIWQRQVHVRRKTLPANRGTVVRPSPRYSKR